MILKVVIHRNIAFTHPNTQKDITELKKAMPFAWEWAFKINMFPTELHYPGLCYSYHMNKRHPVMTSGSLSVQLVIT